MRLVALDSVTGSFSECQTMKCLAFTNQCGTVLSIIVPILGWALSSGCSKPTTSSGQTEQREVAPPQNRSASNQAGAAPSGGDAKILIFRNVRSWNRPVDFEEALAELKLPFHVKPSSEMKSADLSPYSLIIIPGAQWRTAFYGNYTQNGTRFDNYVTNGGTLVLEMNGAEDYDLVLPREVRMAPSNGATNLITLPNHPVLLSQAGKAVQVNCCASHGYLEDVPGDALVLATEVTNTGLPDKEKPTFVEYPCGTGRVIAACQCFHDQDGSGRGAWMKPLIKYAMDRQWYAAKDQP
jgi:hypothetical protein